MGACKTFQISEKFFFQLIIIGGMVEERSTDCRDFGLSGKVMSM